MGLARCYTHECNLQARTTEKQESLKPDVLMKRPELEKNRSQKAASVTTSEPASRLASWKPHRAVRVTESQERVVHRRKLGAIGRFLAVPDEGKK